MMGTGRRDELEDESGKDIEHRSEGRVHKGDDGATTAKILFPFCQDIP